MFESAKSIAGLARLPIQKAARRGPDGSCWIVKFDALAYFNRPTCLSQATVNSAAASAESDVVSIRNSGFSGAS